LKQAARASKSPKSKSAELDAVMVEAVANMSEQTGEHSDEPALELFPDSELVSEPGSEPGSEHSTEPSTEPTPDSDKEE